ncbi:MAG: alpha-E domain-containing protein [Myxococcales bacterium]|nr:MAG: alpha-E domain-containing protein [Myxococcales bacterium]
MIARVASHCFWFGRYLERIESTARSLTVTRDLVLDGDFRPGQCWLPMLIVGGEEAAFIGHFGPNAVADGDTVQEYMAWDDRNLNSLRHLVALARDNARSIRDVLPLEIWEISNELFLWLNSDEARGQFDGHRHEFYRTIRMRVQLTLGLMRGSMLHDLPLDFIWLGVMLERLGQTARMLDMHHHLLRSLSPSQVHAEIETALWLSLMRACSAYEPFLRRHQGRVTAAAAAAFLVLESRFPRSVRYCAHVSYDRLADIRPPDARGLPGARSIERMQALDEWLGHLTPVQLDRQGIHDVLTHVVNEVSAVGDLIAREFLGA